MELIGTWKSEKYNNIFGSIIFEFPTSYELNNIFDGYITFKYLGEHRYNEIIKINISCICSENDETYKENDNLKKIKTLRIIGRNKNLIISQQFQFTLVKYNNKWFGHYTTIYPIDNGLITIK